MKKLLKNAVILSFVLVLAGCGPIKPYEAPIQQGNKLDAEVIHDLDLGMTKNQVVDLLGTPVLGGTFCDNIWDYVYTNQINGGKIEKTNLELEFSNNKLVKITKK